MAPRYGCSDSTPSSLPTPLPKSPPEYPDLHGKRREMDKIQVLKREINYLQAELKFVNGLQPASRSCKEIVDFAAASSDPLVPTLKKNLRRYHRFWKRLWFPRFYLWPIYCCCSSGCAFRIRTPRSCNFDCNWTTSSLADCLSCALPECLQWRPTTPNCLSCALPMSLQCRPNLLNCPSWALPESLQWQSNLSCSSCPDPWRCMNTSCGRIYGSFVLPFLKCLCYRPECPVNIHPSCCLPACRRSICNC